MCIRDRYYVQYLKGGLAMYRKIMSFLEAWKENEHRKPLILQGARDVYKRQPFVYLRNDNDVQRLVTNLFKATTPKGSQSQDPFWEMCIRDRFRIAALCRLVRWPSFSMRAALFFSVMRLSLIRISG